MKGSIRIGKRERRACDGSVDSWTVSAPVYGSMGKQQRPREKATKELSESLGGESERDVNQKQMDDESIKLGT